MNQRFRVDLDTAGTAMAFQSLHLGENLTSRKAGLVVWYVIPSATN